MRKVISVLVLLLALTYSARAGEIQNGTPAPPPEPQQSAEEVTAEGEVLIPPMVELALALLGLI
jgi:hypothetical protein